MILHMQLYNGYGRVMLYLSHRFFTTSPKAKASSLKPVKFYSKEFQKLTSTRPQILSSFLQLGSIVFYTDTDVYWQSDQVIPTFANLASTAANSQSIAINSNNLRPRPHDIVAMVDASPVIGRQIVQLHFIYSIN